MSLQPRPTPPVPGDTARAAFPKGNSYLRLRDELGTVFGDDDFADLYPRRGQPALPPWRLALVTVLQSSTKRHPKLIEAEKLENPLVSANNRGTSHPSTIRRQEVFE